MQKKDIQSILDRVNSGNYTAEEEAIAKYWLHQLNQNGQVNFTEIELAEIGIQVWARLNQDEQRVPVKAHRIWPRLAIASAIALMVLGIGFYTNEIASVSRNDMAHINDIRAGKNGATLTLANGQKILINDALAGNIASQSGVKISKTKEGQIIYEVTDQGSNKIEYNTLTTTRGEQTQVRLPDGSLVFLNAASSLKYPTSFAKAKQRRVGLTGEGYFEISKNKAQPFVVATAKQEVEVLGTHFNISAYNDETDTKTTLLEGSVRVQVAALRGAARSIVLKPGQQSALAGQAIKVSAADTEEAIAWKEGFFRFNEEPIASVMEKVARWYDIEVAYDGGLNAYKDLALGGFISRKKNISMVLSLIEQAGQVRFKINGRKVTVIRK